MTITIQELLDTRLDENTTLRDVFSASIEDIYLDTEEKEVAFYEGYAQKLLDAINEK